MTRPSVSASTMDTLRVRDAMTSDVVTLDQEADLALVGELMELGRFRHLPVVDAEGLLVGLVTHRDLIAAMARALAGFSQSEQRWFGRDRVAQTIRAGEIMQVNVLSVAPTTQLLQAARMLRANKYGCLPVVSRQAHLEGIITEADFVKLVIDGLLTRPDTTAGAPQAAPRHNDTAASIHG